MPGRLEDKVAVITGAASGIGRSTVLRFLAEGARVVAGDLNEVSGQILIEEVTGLGYGDRLRFFRADVSREDDVASMVDLALSSFGDLDVIFNNAGVGGAFGPITEVHVEDWDWTFGVLCRGVFLGIKHGARAMRAAGHGGSIINTASTAGFSGDSGPLAYSSAKAAVINLTRGAAIELAPSLIRVNAICPGGVATPLKAMGRDVEELAADLTSFQPLPVAGRGSHIASVALFLATDDSAFMTGDALVVDGGLTAAGPGLTWREGSERTMAGSVGVTRGTTGEEPITVHRQA